MGATFGNAFVLAPPTEESIEAVVTAIRSALLEDPNTTEVGAEASNRTIVIAALPESRWIAIFDQFADELEESALDLPIAVSATLRAPVIATSCFDSDLASAWLIDRDVIDQVARPLNVLAEMSDGEAEGYEGDAEVWAMRLAGTAAGALREAWETDDVFAESRLAAAAEVLGIPPAWALSGLRYLADHDDVGERSALHFRVSRPESEVLEPFVFGTSPGYDRSPPGQHPPDQGPTPVVLEPGDAFGPSLMGTVQVDGDLLVVMAGPALTEGLISVDVLRVVRIADPGRVTDIEVVDGRSGETPVRMAAVPGRSPAPPGPMGSATMINLVGRASGVGSGLLQVTVGTRRAFERQQQTLEFAVTVREPTGNAP